MKRLNAIKSKLLIEHIRPKRERMGINQIDLAKMCGMLPHTIMNIENFKRRATPDEIKKICQALQLNYQELINQIRITEHTVINEEIVEMNANDINNAMSEIDKMRSEYIRKKFQEHLPIWEKEFNDIEGEKEIRKRADKMREEFYQTLIASLRPQTNTNISHTNEPEVSSDEPPLEEESTTDDYCTEENYKSAVFIYNRAGNIRVRKAKLPTDDAFIEMVIAVHKDQWEELADFKKFMGVVAEIDPPDYNQITLRTTNRNTIDRIINTLKVRGLSNGKLSQYLMSLEELQELNFPSIAKK